VNVPPRIGVLLSHDKSLIGPLTQTLSLRDMYDLLEVIQVDSYNDRAIEAHRKRNER
jgi:hypothetical protein